MKLVLAAALLAVIVPCTIPPAAPAMGFDELGADQRLADFRVEAVYENETGHSMGARFRHVPTGFVLDVLTIRSLPQAFLWVNSVPPSDAGEPHTLEHLLLGKGNKGRMVASLEEMSLGQSSAFTQQRRTCYHFNTAGGSDVFYRLLEAKLDAMINPDFSDEEIRREVCNLGVLDDPQTGEPRLEEKGTVYNEMVSSFERPWSNLWDRLDRMIYGEQHPLALSSGGKPEAIRAMTPADIRAFHAATHHLNNMGAVVAIADEDELPGCLERCSAILARVEPGAGPGEDPASVRDRLPAPRGAAAGEIDHVHFPHENPNEPGQLTLAWPAVRDLDPDDAYLLELFVSLLASGETSNLYRAFIDSQTREMDLGATSVWGGTSDEPGFTVYVGFSNIRSEMCDDATIASIRERIREEIRRIAALDEGSSELAAFNERARARVLEDRRRIRDFLDSPPRWGYRGTGSAWVERFDHLHRRGGFRRNLSLVPELASAERFLVGGGNPWRARIEAWRLVSDPPYAVAATASPGMIDRAETERSGRLSEQVARLQREYGVDTGAAAIARYRDDYDARTRTMEAAAHARLPRFVDNPPMTLDDPLRYEVEELPGAVPLVSSTFESITGGSVGLAFDMRVVPDTLLVYVPALPTVLTDVGVIREGRPVSYDEVIEARRREILGLDVYYDVSYRTERVELVIRGAGSIRGETEKALGWMETAILHPDLRPDNLPRIRDAIDQALAGARNRMRGSEESWVTEPAHAYWRQGNPLLLSANCFLTEAHALHRLRWRLLDGRGYEDEFAGVLYQIAALAGEMDRDALAALLTVLAEDDPTGASGAFPGPEPIDTSALSAGARELVTRAARDLRLGLSDIPDPSLDHDIEYLCRQMVTDLAFPPERALSEIDRTLGLIRHRNVVRAFSITNEPDLDALRPSIVAMLGALDPEPAPRYRHRARPLVSARLQEREGGETSAPVHVALVNENTRSGVHVHTAACASYEETDDERLLRFLSARQFGGHGAHSVFMKTWAAGLAYSNGVRSNESTGRLIYYAERCPDLTQTMEFVINELRNAPSDSTRADYAVAQAFAGTRSGADYGWRGEAMAADLADGITSEVVRRFRQRILELRGREGFAARLEELVEATHGEVLPGYGPSGTEAARTSDAIYFTIGPTKQLDGWESYLRRVEGDVRLHRLYPRDFWLVGPELARPAD